MVHFIIKLKFGIKILELVCKRIDYYVNCIIKLLDEKIASCSGDATIKIWNINSGQCLKTIDLSTENFS